MIAAEPSGFSTRFILSTVESEALILFGVTDGLTPPLSKASLHPPRTY